jgi:hypothetical protein
MWFRRHRNNSKADEALADAQQNLRAVQQRSTEVNQITKALKDMRERNHFAEALEDVIIRRGRK